MRRVTIFTDVACAGKPGRGGGAASLIAGAQRREMSGCEPSTTTTRMEIMAAIEALRALRAPAEVDLHTDSQYLRNGMSTWLARWKRNGWRTADRKPVKNDDRWRAPDALAQTHAARRHLGPGHARHPE